MAKKSLSAQEKKEKKLKNLYKKYLEVDGELHLSEKTVDKQVRTLVGACMEIQAEICRMSDSIKIEDLTKVQDITDIDKKTYLDFVNITALKNNDKLKEKAIARFENDFSNRLTIANLRHSFMESYMSGNDLKITDQDNYEYKPFPDYKSEEFEKIMEDSAKKREYINKTLYPQYKKYAAAAEYITNLDLSYSKFKDLVDWEYYKDGGYPTPTTPGKLWSIFKKYNDAIRLTRSYGFAQSEELNMEFGLEVIVGTPHPVKHPWMADDPTVENLDE